MLEINASRKVNNINVYEADASFLPLLLLLVVVSGLG